MKAEVRALGTRRVWVLRCLSVLVGVGVLAGSELLLRLIPGLGPTPLTRTLAVRRGQTLRAIEPLYARRFFGQRYNGELVASGRMMGTPYLETASAKTLRVVFVGASTVQGFPHPRRLAAASFLQAMLTDAWPAREVQVLNLGITSIASFAVARVLDDALELHPDVAIVYTGHNEFYGLYGAGSGMAPWRQHLRYGLGFVRLSRLLRRGFGKLRGEAFSSRSLLEIMSMRGRVPLGDSRRRTAEEELERNLLAMVHSCRHAEVPLVLCTLVANDRDFAPVATQEPEDAGFVARRRQMLHWVTGGQEVAGDATWTAPCRLLSKSHPGDALSAYISGRALLMSGDSLGAAERFRRARDLDLMPWRAPAGHNVVIRRLASREGVTLADVEAGFLVAAGKAGVGRELMADHLHPSVAGQALLARIVVRRLAAMPQMAGIDTTRLATDAHYRAQLGDLPVEQVGLDQAMAELLAAPPMGAYHDRDAERLRSAAAAGWEHLSAAERQGALRWQTHRDRAPLVLEVADELSRAGALNMARDHYAASMLEAPYTPRGDLWAAVQWGWATRLLRGDFGASERTVLRNALERSRFVQLAAGMDPGFIALIQGVLLHFLGDGQEALPQLKAAFSRPEIRRQFSYALFPALAQELVHAGRVEEARACARQAAAVNQDNPYFGALVETLARGGRVGPPHRAVSPRGRLHADGQ